jgi:hypothetical protein
MVSGSSLEMAQKNVKDLSKPDIYFCCCAIFVSLKGVAIIHAILLERKIPKGNSLNPLQKENKQD